MVGGEVCLLRQPCPLWVKSGHEGRILRCLLYPQKRTSVERLGDVRFVPKAAVSKCSKDPLSKASLFDHLVSAEQDRR
jgi:hypothetical protein